MKTTLSQISAISLGTQLNRNTLSKSGDYPVFNGGMSESGYTSKSNTVANTLIISQGGESAGYVNYITVPFWAGAHCYIVQPTTGDVDKRYLYYYLKAMQPELQYSKSGSSIPGLSKSRLSEFPVYIPDMSQQLRVAHILSALDDKIELNDKINQKLNELARLIYDYWFVQFDFPDEHGHPYRAGGGKMVYSDLLKRKIPA